MANGNSPRRISRRKFMVFSALTTSSLALAACGSPSAATEEATAADAAAEVVAVEAPAVPAAAPTQFNEAPMLAELVAAGELPSVDERLPANPTVVPVLAEIGNYGGVMRRAFKGVSDRWGPSKIQDSSLVRYDLDLTMHPDLIESWEQNEDATEFTLHLRPGLKWSDGTPFDSSAFTWWYDNVLSNTTLTLAPPRNFSTGDPYELMSLSAPDEHTVVMTFNHPKPLFIDFMSRDQPFTPGHYMQQFHMDHVSDTAELEAATANAGFETWDQYYTDRTSWFLNPEKPSVSPWRAVNQLSEALFVMERNPYFHQVDPEGNQLPYLDGVNHRLFEQDDVLNLWIINGEIDFQNRHVGIANYTLFKENEASGNYQILLGATSVGETLSINHATKNERVAEFFQNLDVRKALNVAVDRDAINELVFDGLGVPRQASPSEQSPQHHEGATQAYAFYDPEMANELLDQAGYSERNSEGLRLWNDGSGDPISFIVEGIDSPGSPSSDTLELVLGYLREVGVQGSYNSVERSLYEEHWAANEIEAAWWGAGHDITPFLSHSIYYMGELLDRPWAGAWGRWYRDRDDPNGAPPPDGHFLWEMWDIWAQIVVDPDADRRNELFAQIMDIWAENVPVVGIIGELPGPIIAHSDLANIVGGYAIQDATRDESLINPAQLFWRNPEEHA